MAQQLVCGCTSIYIDLFTNLYAVLCKLQEHGSHILYVFCTLQYVDHGGYQKDMYQKVPFTCGSRANGRIQNSEYSSFNTSKPASNYSPWTFHPT